MADDRESASEALALAAALLAVDPEGLGGARLMGPAGPVRDGWLEALRQLLPVGTPWRRLPQHAQEDRLAGGLDLQATLAAGRPVLQQGLLSAADGGIVVAAMAERLAAGTAAQVAAALDHGRVRVERDGLSAVAPARFALVALDEAEGDDSPLAPALADRLALWLPLRGLGWRSAPQPADVADWAAAVAEARERLPRVQVPDELVAALAAATLALGVDSPRAAWAAVRLARASAALFGRDVATADDADRAAALVLAPRATRLPAPPEDPDEPPPQDAAPPPPPDADAPPEGAPPPPPPAEAKPLEDRVLDAAAAAIPAGLLAQLLHGDGPRTRAARGGKAGEASASRSRGRPLGARRGPPVQGARLHLVATLRAAAPWQPLRRRAWAAQPGRAEGPRVHVRPDDFHVRRFAEKRGTTTVFAVDASGSAALHRLAEAKGAVELLLAECYVRRDEVAVLAFRGRGAELLLPPTRSLVRARRSLAGLPGGGGTPLAAGIELARQVAAQVQREGASPLVVMLTDGRANVTLAGQGGRTQAAEEALAAARRLRALGAQCLLVDTSVRPEPAAAALALAMGARYLALPQADARALSGAVQAVLQSPRAA
ncbi:MAG: magnesium chelatase subunit D [Burkholderiaceae bacterium]|nr:magnesium chelatase subunit D [Burkholderiaceae bacterium]